MNRKLFARVAFVLSFSASTLISLEAKATPCGSDTLQTQDGIQLSALWDCPTTGKVTPSTPVALILPGSGNVGLNGDISGPFTGSGLNGQPAPLSDQLSSALSSASVITFRYAKRGFEDASQLPNQTAPFLISDIHSALAHIQAAAPGHPIHVIGFSEGALLSVHALAQKPNSSVASLHLLAPPTQNIDAALFYQFHTWPRSLVVGKLNQSSGSSDVLEPSELSQLPLEGQLPLVGMLLGPEKGHWSAWDLNGDQNLEIATELQAAYDTTMQVVGYLLTTPQFAGWYQSLKLLPEFSAVAPKISVPTYVYQGLLDAQVDAKVGLADTQLIPTRTMTHVYPSLGHAFAPMMGTLGEVKTSGPFSPELIQDLLSHF